jgi:hypothetical protein
MVTPWWVVLMVTSFSGLSFSFWGWLAVKVIGQGAKIAEIESRIISRENECHGRMAWLQQMDAKLNSVREDVAGIRGALEHLGLERRRG